MKRKTNLNKACEVSDILDSAMDNLKKSIDINTVVGSPIEAGDGSIIVPVSKVYCGIVSGGGELNNKNSSKAYNYPFAGGTGAGFTINPIGFLITRNGQTKFVSTELDKSGEKLVELANRTLKIFLSNLKNEE